MKRSIGGNDFDLDEVAYLLLKHEGPTKEWQCERNNVVSKTSFKVHTSVISLGPHLRSHSVLVTSTNVLTMIGIFTLATLPVAPIRILFLVWMAVSLDGSIAVNEEGV